MTKFTKLQPTIIAFYVSIAAFAAMSMAATAIAQVDTHAAVKRYNRIAKGKNVDEWHKRIFDDDVETRLDAVDSLGEAGTEKSVKPLLDATSDPDIRVRTKAIDYLGVIGDREATPMLTQYLFLNDIDELSKQRILAALGRIRDPRSVDSLVLFAQQTEDETLRCAALHALGEVGHPAATPLVEEYAKSTDSMTVARVATDALGKIEKRAAEQTSEQPTIIRLEKAFRPPPPE
jgi:HEAT repeat protein